MMVFQPAQRGKKIDDPEKVPEGNVIFSRQGLVGVEPDGAVFGHEYHVFVVRG